MLPGHQIATEIQVNTPEFSIMNDEIVIMSQYVEYQQKFNMSAQWTFKLSF